MKKKIVAIFLCMLLFLILLPDVSSKIYNHKTVLDDNNNEIIEQLSFSRPTIQENTDTIDISLKETNQYIKTPDSAVIPVYRKVYSFPIGTRILDIDCKYSNPENIFLEKKITKNQQIDLLYKNLEFLQTKTDKLSSYERFSYKIGAGIEDKKHVIFLTIQYSPVVYNEKDNQISFSDKCNIKITYQRPKQSLIQNNEYQLLIISPNLFINTLNDFVNHKNQKQISTILVSLDEIYNGDHFTVEGRDNPEKIKYFIKNAIEQWGISYVLLIGGVDKLPIRYSYMGHDEIIPTDLYYADIYDQNSDFCNWDSNNNNIFGEYQHDGKEDIVDLYPDIYIGRLPCRFIFDLKNVMNKIIDYEKNTYGTNWFNKIILLGGDTFPNRGVIEGEVVNEQVVQEMSEFTPVRLWTSKNNFNPQTINQEINNGAGFVSYSGHGYEIGFGTSPPHENQRIEYFTTNLFGLSNKEKLPIVFFDACLTAKIDFDIAEYYNIPLIKIPFPTFAWFLIRKSGGGAIATVGATRVAYTMVDENGASAGAGYLGVHFFKAYEPGITVGEMLVKSKNDYLNNVWHDPFTLEEFMLIGDPTLKVGGYQ